MSEIKRSANRAEDNSLVDSLVEPVVVNGMQPAGIDEARVLKNRSVSYLLMGLSSEYIIGQVGIEAYSQAQEVVDRYSS